MVKTYVRVLAIWMLFPLWAFIDNVHAQMTINVLLRVRMIRPAGRDFFGTAFILEVDGRQYLVTAKHVVAGMKAEDTLEVRKGDQWLPMKVKVLRCDDPIDIAVLVPPKQLTVTFPLEPTMGGIEFAQDVYFAGFPYGLGMPTPETYGKFPIPFIKKGIISVIAKENGGTVLYLDGHNNPGFSGGPIVFRDLNQSGFVYKLAGVVSAFRFDTSPVLKPEAITTMTPEDIQKSRIIAKDGHLFRLNQTDEVVRTNTGIVIGYDIASALALIAKNPIGPKVSDKFTP